MSIENSVVAIYHTHMEAGQAVIGGSKGHPSLPLALAAALRIHAPSLANN